MKNRFVFPTLLTLGLATSGAHAANFAMSASDAAGAASFNAGTNWAAGTPTGAANQAPASGNTYQTGAFRIRTPNNTTNITFEGDSLEIQAGGNMRNKTAAIVTVNNLILADTAIVELSQPAGQAVGTLAGNISLTSGTAVFMGGNSTDGTNHVFTISSTISGSGGITTGNPALSVGGALANSSGTVVLTGDNSYSGNTAATSGILLVNNTAGSGTGTGTVTVGTNGTLGGTGSISGATTVNGRLAPGAGVGTLTFTGGLTLGALAANSLRFQLGDSTTAGTTYDTVATSSLDIGNLDFADFQFTNTGTLAPGIYTLISSTVPITGSIGAASGTVGGFPGTLSVSGGNSLILTISDVPDTTAPTWVATYPKVDNVTSSGFNALAATNETGTAYFLVLPDGDPQPDAATVQSTGTAIALTANVEASSAVTGLTPSTSYDVYFVAQDTVPNLQAEPVKVDVTLPAFQPANFVLAASDGIGASSFNAGTNWGAGTPSGAANLAPSAGNTYQTAAFRIRTPQAADNFTFAGASLEIQSGGNMRNKTAGVVTIDNFILADTAIVELSQPNGQTAAGLASGSLAGNISLTSGAATFMAGNAGDGVNHVFTIDASISGAGGLNTNGSSGTVVLTGANTYTGPTAVTAGTLLLVGGSQTSPITVGSGATLGLDADSPTVSTSTVTFNSTSKVRVSGTPAVVTLMTASNIDGIIPVLDPPIPGYALQVTPTQVNLIVGSASPYDTWALGPFANPFTNTAPGVDFDNDGLNNLLEFVLGGDPTISQSGIAPAVTSASGSDLVLTFKRSDVSENAPATTVKVQVGTDLITWDPADDITIAPGDVGNPGPIGASGASYIITNSGGFDTVVVTIPKAAAAKKFARLMAIQP